MKNVKHVREIRCAACGQVTLARAEPVYEGFKKTGEAFICTGCGHRYASREETPFVQAGDARPRVFTDADRPDAGPSLFREDERRHSCCWCRHFVVNPFSQRCGLTNAFTEATGLCLRFERKEETPEEKEKKKPADAGPEKEGPSDAGPSGTGPGSHG